MSRVILRLAAAGACVAAMLLAAPTASVAGDRGYEGYGYRHYDSNPRRDGNVFYNAYNSYDGYYRHNRGLGYWERPSDRYYGYRSWGSHYGYDDEGYGYGDRDEDDEGYGHRYGGRDRYRHGHYAGYGWYRARPEPRRCDCDGDDD